MGQFVPDLDKWDYTLPSHFLDSGRPILAVSVAQVMQEADPVDIRLRVNLSKVYREVKAVDKSLGLFRGYPGQLNRVAYTEWSVAEGYAGNSAAAAVIAAAAICDLPGVVPPTRDSGRAVSGLSFALRRLNEQYGEKVFLDGALAIAEMGLRFSSEELTKQHLIESMMREYGVTISGKSIYVLIEDLTTAVKRVFDFINVEEMFHGQFKQEVLTSFNGLRSLANLDHRQNISS